MRKKVEVILAMLYQFANNGKLSGRADGNVYMRDGRIRGMTVPSLVQNSNTARVRSSFAAFSNGWNSLTADQIAGWNAATGFSTSDRFGRTVPLFGKNLFVSLNQNLASIGFSQISDAPTPQLIQPPTDASFIADASAHTVALTFAPTPVPSDNYWIVYATGMKSAGTRRPGASQYRLLTVLPNAATSPAALGTLYEARFGTLVEGQRIFIKIVAVNINSGQALTGTIVDNDVVG